MTEKKTDRYLLMARVCRSVLLASICPSGTDSEQTGQRTRPPSLCVVIAGMEVPPIHLVQSEINAVTSAIRKHVRNASSSSFLGGGTNITGVGPVAGGSTTASLLRNAVASASSTSQYSSSNGVAPHTPLTAKSAGSTTLRVAHGGKMKERNGSLPPLSASSRTGYTDSRRDEGVGSLLNNFTILRAQLRESPGELDASSLHPHCSTY